MNRRMILRTVENTFPRSFQPRAKHISSRGWEERGRFSRVRPYGIFSKIVPFPPCLFFYTHAYADETNQRERSRSFERTGRRFTLISRWARYLNFTDDWGISNLLEKLRLRSLITLLVTLYICDNLNLNVI